MRSPHHHGRRAPAAPWQVLGLGIAVLLAACGSSPQASESEASPATTAGPTVVTTTTILGDVVEEVVGDAGEAVTLMPVGADPHTYQPSARQVTEMQDADLLVVNGANLEESLEDAVREAEDAGAPILRAVEHVDTLTYDGEHGHGDDDHADDDHADDEDGTGDGGGGGDADADDHADEGSIDPHIWMDPRRMADVVSALGQRLVDITGDSTFAQRADDYSQQLRDLDEEIESILEPIPSGARTLVTNHDSFAYFADRYDFEIAGTVIPSVSTGAEPSAQDLEQLAETIRHEEVPAIFAETTQTDQLAQTLAAEVGAEVAVVPLYTGSLDEEGPGPGTYRGMLRSNAERIADALAG